jgi:hypothetical protein
MVRSADGRLQIAVALRTRGPTYILCTGFPEHRETLTDIIRGVLRVRVHADDHSATGYSDGGVQTSRDDAAWIIDDSKMWGFRGELLQNRPCSIVRHAVRDDYL